MGWSHQVVGALDGKKKRMVVIQKLTDGSSPDQVMWSSKMLPCIQTRPIQPLKTTEWKIPV